MPTRRGKALLVSSLALYILARAASTGELYALAAAALSFPLAAVAFVRWGRHSLRFQRSLSPRRLFAGHDVKITVAIENHTSRPSPPLLIEDDAPVAFGGPLRTSVPSLGRRQAATFALERRAQSRGRFTVGPLRARLIDPFGLASVHREVAPASKVVVYPQIEALTEHAPPEARGDGGRSLIHRLAIAGDDFYGVRGWQDGDDLRKIHWRTTARRDELMIRQDEVRPFPRATVLIDSRLAIHRDTSASSSMEWTITAAASIVWELARQGFALRLGTADAPPGGARWGREAVDPLLGALAVTERAATRSLAPMLRNASRAGAGGALLAIMAPPDPDCLTALSHLRRAYQFRGAILLDLASFRNVTARERAAADQRLAEADRMLARAGWDVVVASSSDKVRTIWQTMLASGARRPSSPSLPS